MSAVWPGAFSTICERYLPMPSCVMPRDTVMPVFGTSANLIVSFGCAHIASARSSPTLPLTTSMIATRTLPSSRRARPFELPLVDMRCASINELLADVQDALRNGEPRGCCEEIDRPLEPAPRSEYETGGDDDDALGPGAQADVAAQSQCFRLCADVRHEEGAGDGHDREEDRDVVPGAGEDEPDRSEHRALADPVGRGVEEGAERRRLPAGTRERAVEDVEHRADDEHRGGEPVEKELVPTLEGDEHGRRQTEGDPGRRECVRGEPGACEARHRQLREGAGAGRVARLDPAQSRSRGLVHRVHAGALEVEVDRNPAMGRL